MKKIITLVLVAVVSTSGCAANIEARRQAREAEALREKQATFDAGGEVIVYTNVRMGNLIVTDQFAAVRVTKDSCKKRLELGIDKITDTREAIGVQDHLVNEWCEFYMNGQGYLTKKNDARSQ